jgi:hypothetical protein
MLDRRSFDVRTIVRVGVTRDAPSHSLATHRVARKVCHENR